MQDMRMVGDTADAALREHIHQREKVKHAAQRDLVRIET